jgi:hypothetical protein
MSMLIKNLAVVIAALLLSASAFADDAAPDSAGPRYDFHRVGDGYVRLDRQTGEVALCDQRGVGWACQMAPEDRAVLEGEIERLRNENAELKKDLLSRGLSLPPGVTPEPPATPGGEVILRLPDNADVDRAMAYVGRLWNRFVEALARAGQQVLNKS